MKASVRKPRRYLWQKLAILIVGLILSVVLHELFHLVIHWGEITSVSFFRNGAITEMVVLEHKGDDLEGEELAAYFITLLVMMATVMAIYKVGDVTDTRTVRQILFPGRGDLKGMKTSDFFKLAGKADLLPPAPDSPPSARNRKS